MEGQMGKSCDRAESRSQSQTRMVMFALSEEGLRPVARALLSPASKAPLPDPEKVRGAGLSGSVGCAVRLETRRSRVQSPRGRQHSFVEIDQEIFSTVILSLPLIQEWQLSVSGERMCTILVNCLED